MRVTVETRKAFTIEIGGKRRRFWTEAAAYYKLAASLLGRKYLGALKAIETGDGVDDFTAAMLGVTVEQAQSRADRAARLFHRVEDVSGQGHLREYFDTNRWQAYVRRVATKMRALDRANGGTNG